MTISELAPLATLLTQVLTGERAVFPSNEVVVAYADRETATAVGSPLTLPDGKLRLHVYTVYRNGVPLSDGRSPAYSDEWLDFDCHAKSFRLFRSSFYRPNDDTVEMRNVEAPFVSVEGEFLRERQLETACGTAERPTYGNYFLFMEAYGLRDGRPPRSEPGPLVP